MLLRNAFALTTPCLALFLLACNDKGNQQAQPQAVPSQAAAQKDAQPATTPAEAAKPSASILKDTNSTHRHHVVRAAHYGMAHHVHAAPAVTASAPAAEPAEAAPAASAVATLTVPTGTVLVVRLTQELGSKTSHAGDAFTATVSEAIVVDGKPVIPEGSTVSGKVTEAAPTAMLHKGVLQVTLNSINVHGQEQTIQTSTVSEIEKSDSEHAGNLAESASAAAPAAGMVGNASDVAAPATGIGASATGISGAGKSSSLAGGGLKTEAEAKAATVVAALTGSKDLVFPAQAAMKFTLEQNLDIKP